MDLQEKLNAINSQIKIDTELFTTIKNRLKAYEKTAKQYLKLIEKAKSLEAK